MSGGFYFIIIAVDLLETRLFTSKETDETYKEHERRLRKDMIKEKKVRLFSTSGLSLRKKIFCFEEEGNFRSV